MDDCLECKKLRIENRKMRSLLLRIWKKDKDWSVRDSLEEVLFGDCPEERP